MTGASICRDSPRPSHECTSGHNHLTGPSSSIETFEKPAICWRLAVEPAHIEGELGADSCHVSSIVTENVRRRTLSSYVALSSLRNRDR